MYHDKLATVLQVFVQAELSSHRTYMCVHGQLGIITTLYFDLSQMAMWPLSLRCSASWGAVDSSLHGADHETACAVSVAMPAGEISCCVNGKLRTASLSRAANDQLRARFAL